MHCWWEFFIFPMLFPKEGNGCQRLCPKPLLMQGFYRNSPTYTHRLKNELHYRVETLPIWNFQKYAICLSKGLWPKSGMVKASGYARAVQPRGVTSAAARLNLEALYHKLWKKFKRPEPVNVKNVRHCGNTVVSCIQSALLSDGGSVTRISMRTPIANLSRFALWKK